MHAKGRPAELTRRPLAFVLASAIACGPVFGGLLQKGDPFLPFGLRAIDGTRVIVTTEGGRLTVVREPASPGGPLRSKTRPAAVLLDFWATWCVPCRSSMPYIQKIYDRFRPPAGQTDGGAAVFGIALDEGGAAVVRPAFAKLKYSYPMLADPIPGLTDPALLRTAVSMIAPYGAEQIPVVYVIDAQGRIAYAHMGFDKDKMAELERAVTAAVAGPNK
jgi:thiol-disulfide isomerase/thioredoxin